MRLIVRDPHKGYVDTAMWIPKGFVNVEGIKNALTFQFFENREPTLLQLWRETDHHLVVPREFYRADEFGVPMVDCRPLSFPTVNIESRIVLDAKRPHLTVQRDALAALLSARGGVLELACGLGKTVIALELISRLHVPALIVVDNTQLLVQWQKEITKFLNVPFEEIGLIGSGVFDWKKPIVMGTYQTLAKLAPTFPEEARRWFGVTIWDEGHHVAAPTFSKSVDLFYGRRYALTATPERADGLNVIVDFHIGPTIYKNKHQDLHPDIAFLWSGFELDQTDPKVMEQVCDRNGALHIGKLAGYFGQWRDRLEFIVGELRKLHNNKRRILVLSYSIAEVVNLLALWNNIPQPYSDIPIPTPADVKETVPGIYLEEEKIRSLQRSLGGISEQLKDSTLNPVKRGNLEKTRKEILYRLKAHAVWRKLDLELKKRQRAYIKDLLKRTHQGNAGLLIQHVKPGVRIKMLESKSIVFAIMKFGREGLDCAALDTLFACEPLSDPGGLEQLLGRIQRLCAGKQQPKAIFVEDAIGLMVGMCNKMRSHLRSWPVEQGGPYDWTRPGHPQENLKNKVLRFRN